MSEQYLEQRRSEILAAAQRCFARKGFHETSLQDIFRESGLSAGAVYRYFKSKDELVQAIAARALGQLAGVVEAALAEDPMPGIWEITGRLAEAIQKIGGPDGPARIALPAWAASLHDPAVAAIVREALQSLRARLTQVAERLRAQGRLPADADAEAVGATVFGLLPGFLLQYLILGDVDAATLRTGLRQLTWQEDATALASPAGRGKHEVPGRAG